MRFSYMKCHRKAKKETRITTIQPLQKKTKKPHKTIQVMRSESTCKEMIGLLLTLDYQNNIDQNFNYRLNLMNTIITQN